ncbi:MAG TPA: protein kinase family protein [Streptosporangiaceae bacterium]|nr:protein kinase family protein [Streptosporangiaceae bacterium]
MSTFTSEPGIRLGGRYRLEDRLATAAGWSAWKAIDEILARPVSVITFEAGFPRLEQVVTAARAASRLTDTRLTQVFDVEDTWDHAYIVLEWPVGDSLAELVAAGPMDPATGARIVAEAAAALSGAHAAGLAHLCLRPDSVRWTAGGGVKVTGLGIDAALSGVMSEDPELADTRGLGQLLYSVLTGFWPGPDYPELPPAPESDGQPRRPGQVRAGVPDVLDDVTERALALPGQDSHEPFTAPAELAAALRAAIPPVQVPPAAAQYDQRRDADHRSSQRSSQLRTMAQRTLGQRVEPRQTRPSYEAYQEAGRVGRRASVRAIAIGALVLIAVAGASTAALHFLHKSPPAATNSRSHSPSASSPASSLTAITPQSALGFDALNPAGDAGDENSDQARNVLDGNPQGWNTQYYRSAHFGNLKAGTGFILNLGAPAQVSSVTVTFGTAVGAIAQLKVGNSDVRSPSNLAAMHTVAPPSRVAGAYTFTIKHPVSGQYLVIWFTKLPPLAGKPGWFEAQIFKVAVTGTS